jgi:acetyl-CoA carboxylase biotin carboxylase subunit
MFEKVLVANRGEIALRIIRSCRELGVETAVIFSDVDRDTPAVWEADEAYPIGGPQVLESYLDMEKIISTAIRARADAIHPGYGFLAENPTFAERCRAAGLVFIGPPSEAMAKMGDKARGRRTMREAGVPVIPGTMEGVLTPEDALSAAENVGFPLLLKPVAGGGGKGMRVVRGEKELLDAFRFSQSEAMKAFGDGRIYLERYLGNPRHIEIQVLADGLGNVIHLGERECSIQRRHQKMIEEAPSPVVTDETRERLGEWACLAARTAGYSNAGTVEFLRNEEGEFYFLEMNTRLQVEHPVTEMITGVDIVAMQLRIAAGEGLNLSQDDIRTDGVAIECRISSEDPENDFLPSSGVLEGYEPPAGPWVRVDSGVVAGSNITLFYDPLFAKLVVWGKDRGAAVARMRRALEEFRVSGIKTTIPFHRVVMDHPGFVSGDYDTGFLDKEFREVSHDREGAMEDEVQVAALIAHVKEGRGHVHVSTEGEAGGRPCEANWHRTGLEASTGGFDKWRRLRGSGRGH